MAKLSNSRYLEGSSRKTDPILFSDNIFKTQEKVFRMINEFDEDIEDNKRVLMFLELIKATQREGEGPPVIHLFYF